MSINKEVPPESPEQVNSQRKQSRYSLEVVYALSLSDLFVKKDELHPIPSTEKQNHKSGLISERFISLINKNELGPLEIKTFADNDVIHGVLSERDYLAVVDVCNAKSQGPEHYRSPYEIPQQERERLKQAGFQVLTLLEIENAKQAVNDEIS